MKSKGYAKKPEALGENPSSKKQGVGKMCSFLLTSSLGIDTSIFMIDTISNKKIMPFSGSFGDYSITTEKINV